MSSTSNRLIKNISVLMLSQLATWVLTLLLTLFLPRYLGPESNGILAIAVSIWTLLQVFIGFGGDTYLVKQIARDPEQVYTFLGTTLGLRTIFYGIGLLLLSIGCWLLKMPLESVILVQLIGVSFFVGSLASAVTATLQGLEIMEYISIANVASRAINSFLGITVLLLGFGLYAVTGVMIVAAVALLVIQLYYLQRHRPLQLRFERRQVLPLLRNSLPYVATAMVMVGYAQINVLVIGLMLSTKEVGWYGAASQLFGTLLFLPVVFATALLPQMTRAFSTSADVLPLMFRKSLELVLLIGVPIGLGLLAVAEPLVSFIFGAEFGPTGPVLQVMGLALIVMYLNVMIGQYFTSIDRQNTWTVTIALSAVMMAGMTVVIVPWCQQLFGNGAVGGAISLLLAEASMVVVGGWLLRRELLNRALIWSIARIAIAGLVMVLAVWLARSTPLALMIGLGATAYSAMILLLRIVPREDFELLRAFVGSLLGRLRSGHGTAGAGGD